MESVPDVKPRPSAAEAEKQKKEIVTASFYIKRPSYRRLKELAARQGINLQDIFNSGVNMWLAEQKEAPLNTIEGEQ